MKKLTTKQTEVLNALRKKNMDFLAAATEEHWRKGEEYYIDSRCNVSQALRRKFKQGNEEAVS